MDNGSLLEDHLPLLAAVRFQYEAQQNSRKPRKMPDPRKIRNAPESVLMRVCEELPKVRWDINPREHAASVVKKLQKSLCEEFGSTRKPPSRGCISEKTWLIRTARVDARRFILRILLEKDYLRLVIHVWRFGEPTLEIRSDYFDARSCTLAAIHLSWVKISELKKDMRKSLKSRSDPKDL